MFFTGWWVLHSHFKKYTSKQYIYNITIDADFVLVVGMDRKLNKKSPLILQIVNRHITTGLLCAKCLIHTYFGWCTHCGAERTTQLSQYSKNNINFRQGIL